MSTEITVGNSVTVKVGSTEINATLLAIEPNGYKVRSNSSGKEFHVSKITAVSMETQETDTPNPAPECQPTAKPEKRLSLMDAAVEVLKRSEYPLNTREMVKAAIEQGYWIPTACKTPEQTLYGSIFREIATKENPRIVKSEQKGKFKLG